MDKKQQLIEMLTDFGYAEDQEVLVYSVVNGKTPGILMKTKTETVEHQALIWGEVGKVYFKGVRPDTVMYRAREQDFSDMQFYRQVRDYNIDTIDSIKIAVSCLIGSDWGVLDR